jgi:hypothetical protein
MGKLIGRTGRKVTGAVRGKTITARRMAAALLSVALLSGAAAWSAASASAGVAQVSSSSAKTAIPSAALANAEITQVKDSSATTFAPDVSTATLYFADGASYSYDCTDGQTWDVDATVVEVLNACGTRVWLHQYSNNTGESWCTSPVSASDPPEIVYANLYISSNTAAC